MEDSTNKAILGLIIAILITASGFFLVTEVLVPNDKPADDKDSNKETTSYPIDNTSTSNIKQHLVSNSNLSTLVSTIDKADSSINSSLNSTNNYTVFAPTNEAFSNIQETYDALITSNNTQKINDILNLHIVDSKILSADLQDGQMITTLQGETLTVTKNESGDIFVNNAKIISKDNLATNGVVHVIDTVLVPSEN